MREPPDPEGAISAGLLQVHVLDAIKTLSWDLEQGLRALSFDEITLEDRITFVECVLADHVSRAVSQHRHDVAHGLRCFARRRIEGLAGECGGRAAARDVGGPGA